MKTIISLAVAAILASSVIAQTPYVEGFGQRKDALPQSKKSGVYWPEKRIETIVHHYAGGPLMGVYYQPYDFPIPAGPRNAPRLWYPVQIDRWSDGKEWVRSWAYAGFTPYEYRLWYDENAK